MTTLLFIHGFPLDRTIWDAQVARLQDAARVVAPDLRGFGGSEGGPGGVWTMEEFARDLLRAMDAVGADRFVPVGHSMGGYILFAMQRLAPQRLAGAALVSTRATPDSPEQRSLREDTARNVLEKGVSVVEDSMLAKLFAPGAPAEAVEKARAAVQRATATGVAAALRGMARRPDARPQLPQLRVPTLVLAGRRDAIVPPAESEAMAAAIPDARLVWCTQSGHMPMLEEPDLVADALKRFVNTVA